MFSLLTAATGGTLQLLHLETGGLCLHITLRINRTRLKILQTLVIRTLIMTIARIQY